MSVNPGREVSRLYDLLAEAESLNNGTLFPSMKAAMETETENRKIEDHTKAHFKAHIVIKLKPRRLSRGKVFICAMSS